MYHGRMCNSQTYTGKSYFNFRPYDFLNRLFLLSVDHSGRRSTSGLRRVSRICCFSEIDVSLRDMEPKEIQGLISDGECNCT
jgi:hypothetical protein